MAVARVGSLAICLLLISASVNYIEAQDLSAAGAPASLATVVPMVDGTIAPEVSQTSIPAIVADTAASPVASTGVTNQVTDAVAQAPQVFGTDQSAAASTPLNPGITAVQPPAQPTDPAPVIPQPLKMRCHQCLQATQSFPSASQRSWQQR